MDSNDTISILAIMFTATVGLSTWFVANAIVKVSRQLSDISKTLSQIRDIQKKQLRSK